MWIIREEQPGDRADVRAVVVAAFGRSDEADLVERLQAAGEVVLSLVAVAPGHSGVADPPATDGVPDGASGEGGEGTIVGHVLFSLLPLSGGEEAVAAAALAPLAVHPDQQRRGVGAALVREGLARLEARQLPAVVVLGDPDYYQRFGFRADLAARLIAPFSGGAFMAIELQPGSLANDGLAAHYAPAFAGE